MTAVREIMHTGVAYVGEDETLATAARKMRDHHVGAMPVCGRDNRLHGMVTDRDIVVRCVAAGGDPTAVPARELARGTSVWVAADADVAEALRLMEQNKIRRLPVVDNHRLVGMVSEADLATHLGRDEIVGFTESVYTAPPTT